MSITQRLLATKLRQRARWNGRLLQHRLHPGERVLDFGCGDMATAHYLRVHARVRIVGIDTIDIRLPHTHHLPFVDYKGGRLPFVNGTFDTAIAAFSLHHTDDPAFYLSDLARVARRIIIIENTYRTRLQKLFVCGQDFLGNRLESLRMAIPFNFHSEAEWERMFQHLGLNMIHREPVESRFGLRWTPNFLAELLPQGTRRHSDIRRPLTRTHAPAV
jgi:SAM-dependent methyltransferase